MAVSKTTQEAEILDGTDGTLDLSDQVRGFVDRIRRDVGEDGLRDVVRQLQDETGMGPGLGDGGQPLNGGAQDGRGLRWFFAEIWSYPQFRMLAFALVVAAWLAASSEKLGAGHIAFAVAAAFLFCKWAEAVYRLLRAGQLVLKCMAAITGLVLVAALVFNEPKSGAGLPAAIAALTLTALLVMSKATEKLAGAKSVFVRFFREWF
jgi:hypothetical protein